MSEKCKMITSPFDPDYGPQQPKMCGEATYGKHDLCRYHLKHAVYSLKDGKCDVCNWEGPSYLFRLVRPSRESEHVDATLLICEQCVAYRSQRYSNGRALKRIKGMNGYSCDWCHMRAPVNPYIPEEQLDNPHAERSLICNYCHDAIVFRKMGLSAKQHRMQKGAGAWCYRIGAFLQKLPEMRKEGLALGHDVEDEYANLLAEVKAKGDTFERKAIIKRYVVDTLFMGHCPMCKETKTFEQWAVGNTTASCLKCWRKGHKKSLVASLLFLAPEWGRAICASNRASD